MVFKNGEIDHVIITFFNQIEDDVAVFVLHGNQHYEITYDSKFGSIQRDPKDPNYSITKDKRFKI